MSSFNKLIIFSSFCISIVFCAVLENGGNDNDIVRRYDYSEMELALHSEWDDKIKFPPVNVFKRRNKPFTINVEGIVGTGKSTFLGFMKGYPFMDILPEPVDKWTNLNGSDLLQLVFDDPSRWSMAQESYVQLTLLEEHLRNYGIVKVMERSVHSARYCFVEQFHVAGQMSDAEYHVLDEWYKLLNSRHELDIQTDLTIYLQVDPIKVYERIVHRARPEEKKLSLEFLQRLHRVHEDWLVHRNTSFLLPSPNILVINTDHPFETMKRIYRDLAKKIWNVIPKEIKSMCNNLHYND